MRESTRLGIVKAFIAPLGFPCMSCHRSATKPYNKMIALKPPSRANRERLALSGTLTHSLKQGRPCCSRMVHETSSARLRRLNGPFGEKAVSCLLRCFFFTL